LEDQNNKKGYIMKPTKTVISGIFANIRSFGITVINMTNNVSLRKGMTGFVDIVVITDKRIYFVEIKLTETKDRFSPKQKEIAERLNDISCNNEDIFYYVITDIQTAKDLSYSIVRHHLENRRPL